MCSSSCTGANTKFPVVLFVVDGLRNSDSKDVPLSHGAEASLECGVGLELGVRERLIKLLVFYIVKLCSSKLWNKCSIFNGWQAITVKIII